MAVEVTVRCYGPARREAGAEVLAVVLDRPGTVDDVLAALATSRGAADGLVRLLPTCAVAIDDELVARDHRIDGPIEVALLPPVAGG